VSDPEVQVATILAQTVTAIMATAALIVSIISLRLQRPRLKISASPNTFMDRNFNAGEVVYMINVANKCPAPVTVTQLYLWPRIWLRRGWKFALPDVRGDRALPCRLDREDGAHWWVEYEALREVLRQSGLKGKVRIKIEAIDATGDSHTTRTSIVLNAPRWRRAWQRARGR
jgi:hypothetical protein